MHREGRERGVSLWVGAWGSYPVLRGEAVFYNSIIETATRVTSRGVCPPTIGDVRWGKR
ncbi:RNA-dependent RNA polymerase [Sesbania bispinosa]|nr:RNA-dependent RNA polymerase [Sesbania bispinosa]